MPKYIYINSKLEQFFKDWYPHDTDRTDYVQVLRDMNEVNSIKKLVEIHDRLLDKILSLKYQLISMPTEWYLYDHSSEELMELDSLLNKQIERVFDSCNKPTDDFEIKCLVNLRPAKNRIEVFKNILPRCSENVRKVYEDIRQCIKIKEDAPTHLTPYNINTNEYKDNLNPYIHAIKRLIKTGYIRDLRDISFETQAKIEYIQDIKSLLLIIPIVLLLIFVFAYFFSKVGIFSLILLMGLPGALISFLKKG